MKHLLLLLQLFILSSDAAAQVNWISFEELTTKTATEKKPVLLFIHTDWCKVCKMQEATVFSDENLSKKINTQFYTLKLNAEEKQSLNFLGRSYAGANTSHYHELVEYLGKSNKEIHFPTLIVFNRQFEVILKKGGLVSREEFFHLMDLMSNPDP